MRRCRGRSLRPARPRRDRDALRRPRRIPRREIRCHGFDRPALAAGHRSARPGKGRRRAQATQERRQAGIAARRRAQHAGGEVMILGAFERMVAFRYLRARPQEGFVSVIAIFSLLGIMLGVATLIITMAVMNGFRAELLGRILGFNGHVSVYAAQGPLTDYGPLALQVTKLPGIKSATPMIEGQVMATAKAGATGALVRGIAAQDIAAQPL